MSEHRAEGRQGAADGSRLTSAIIIAGICALIIVAGVAALYVSREDLSRTSTVTATNASAITDYSVCFSPAGNCQTELISAINNATKSIHVMIYEFSNTAIADALVAAEKRGVDVKVIMDGSEASTDNVAVVPILNQSGIPLKIYTPLNGILHDKIAIIDDTIVVTGSYNWSYAANNFNDENLLILHSPPLAVQYEVDFQRLWNATSTVPG